MNCAGHPPHSGDWQAFYVNSIEGVINLDFPSTRVSGWFTDGAVFFTLNLHAYSGLNGTGTLLDSDQISYNAGFKEFMTVVDNAGLIQSVKVVMLLSNGNSMDDLRVIYAAPAISVTPQDNIVAAGDTLVYEAVITNTAGHPVSFDVLAEIIRPNNDTTRVEEQRINLGPNQQLMRNGLKCPIPETAATGSHTFRAYTEILNTDHLLSEDTFGFSVYKVAAFTPDTHSKVLISTLHDDTYPSPDQVGDRKIQITATIDPVFQDQEIYFRTYDPDDSSSYETDTNANDNHDPGMPRGNLKVAPGYTMIAGSEIKDANDNTVEVGVRTDGSGTAVVVLTVTDRYAGDNYQVYAAGHPGPKSGQAATTLTSYLVAWKRIYVEEDMMYKVGSDLVDDFRHDTNSLPDTVEVQDVSQFQVGNQIVVFDATNPGGEPTAIDGIDSVGNLLALHDDLQNDYDAGYPGQGAAVARPADGVYDADLVGRFTDAYGLGTIGKDGGSFVEMTILPSGGTATPFEGTFPNDPAIVRYSDVWFENRNKQNYFQVIGASNYGALGDQVFGGTASSKNFCIIFVGEVDFQFQVDPLAANADVTVHEIGHQFSLTNVDSGHPSGVWCNQGLGTDFCVMSYERNRESGYTEFCADTLSTHHNDDVRNQIDGL
jgi:hypothetical protein